MTIKTVNLPTYLLSDSQLRAIIETAIDVQRETGGPELQPVIDALMIEYKSRDESWELNPDGTFVRPEPDSNVH